MRVFLTAAMMVLLAGPAYAQTQPIPRYGEVAKEKSKQEKEAEQESERAYQRSLGNIPDKQTPNDPWGNVRSETTPKAAAKAAPAKRAKTVDTAK